MSTRELKVKWGSLSDLNSTGNYVQEEMATLSLKPYNNNGSTD